MFLADFSLASRRSSDLHHPTVEQTPSYLGVADSVAGAERFKEKGVGQGLLNGLSVSCMKGEKVQSSSLRCFSGSPYRLQKVQLAYGYGSFLHAERRA